ncbi:putative molybdenum carrier protein [Pirellulaceae bacterium SH501]
MTARPSLFLLPPAVPLERIISGGQTGVDRAALDAAIAAGIAHGGWCPKGRLAEDGVIPLIYQLQELSACDYAERTKQNVLVSDATLILTPSRLTGGSLLTFRIAKELRKPCLTLQLPWMTDSKLGSANEKRRSHGDFEFSALAKWLSQHPVKTLNIAGPRASKIPKAYETSFRLLKDFFEALNTPTPQNPTNSNG